MPTAEKLKAQHEVEKEEQLQAALQAVTESGVNASGNPNYSFRAAADDFGVPRTTLAGRWNGRKTRRESHAEYQTLTPPQEEVLVAWMKELGRRGVPVSLEALAEHASTISGKPVGLRWGARFRTRHDDLRARWTTNLEACRANALNPTLVAEFYDILVAIYDEFDLPIDAIWNMDEKGVILGIGGRTLVLVDRDQKTVNQIHDGNRELVTMIEAVCADGRSLAPMAIFKGKQRNLEWGRENPGQASIAFSENGWTDMELGFLWLQRHFEPLTRPENDEQWRLLILDGHNSHCTFKFCQFAAAHKIIIVCLPPHTTHCLQPCDVGVFGPLASSWKKEVTLLSGKFIKVTKSNLLHHYHNARQRAFSSPTIQASFRKTGIWPHDPSVIEPSAFAPALNTSTQSAMPISATGTVPSADANPRTPAPAADTREDSLTADADAQSEQAASESEPTGDIGPPSEAVLAFARPDPLPAALPSAASRSALRHGYDDQHGLLEEAHMRIEADHAHKKLMEAENESLRKQLFDSRNKARTKRKEGGSSARHMTSGENLDLLAFADWKAHISAVHKDASKMLKAIRKAIEEQDRAAVKERDAATRDSERAERDARKEIERQEKAAEKAADRERHREQREEAAADKRAEAEEEKALKKAETERKREQAKEKKAHDKSEKTAQKARDKTEREAAKCVQKEAKAAETQAHRLTKKRASDGNDDENHPPKHVHTSGVHIAGPAELQMPVNGARSPGPLDQDNVPRSGPKVVGNVMEEREKVITDDTGKSQRHTMNEEHIDPSLRLVAPREEEDMSTDI